MRIALLTAFLALPALAQSPVPWRAVTPPIPSAQAGDPALGTYIFGTDTAQTGFYIFELDGTPNSQVPVGITRSIDLRPPLAAVSSVNSGVLLYDVGFSVVPAIPASITVSTPGQLALGNLADGGFTLYVDSSSAVLRHFALERSPGGTYTVTPLPDVVLGGVPAGLAWDDVGQTLYASVPGEGLVAVAADGTQTTVLPSATGTLGGIALLQGNPGLYVFMASPSTDAVDVTLVDPDGGTTALGSFSAVTPDGGTEAARSPAYLDVSTNVPGYPGGAVLVHDGISATYKLLALADVAQVIALPIGPATDAGVSDAGTNPGTGGGSGSQGAVGGTGPSTSGPSAMRNPTCSTVPFVALPALLLLWWIRRPRS